MKVWWQKHDPNNELYWTKVHWDGQVRNGAFHLANDVEFKANWWGMPLSIRLPWFGKMRQWR